MIKLVLTDLDDTLIPFGSPCAPDIAVASMGQLLAAGVRVGPVTGRPPHAMEWMFPGHPECYQTGAFANGQIIRIDGETVREERVPAGPLQKLAEVLEDTEQAFVALYDKGYTEVVSLTEGRLREDMSLGAFATDWVEVRELPADGSIKCNVQFAGTYTEMLGLFGRLKSEVPELDFVLPSQTARVIDVSPKGWGKGRAVHYLADELGLSLDEVAVFGDSDNDLSMIEAVPNSVAVANASPEIRDAARWHIGASADNAVADAFGDIALAAATGSMPFFMRG